MINKVFRFLNSIIFTNLKFIIIKFLHPFSFSFSFNNLISPRNIFDIQSKGKIILRRNLNIPYKNIFGVRECGTLEISDGSFINNNCQIIAHKKIIIGKNVCIGPNTIIMDHDHAIEKNGIQKKVFKSESIIINDGAWIGANCVILKGTNIGKNAVIGAGSVVKGNVPDNTILIQKRLSEFKKISNI